MIVAALFLAFALACATDSSPDPTPVGDPFAGVPADGPIPEIGPAPDDYVATAAGAPATDIWIGRLDRDDDGQLSVHDLVNVTDRDGYDNQPSFDPSGSLLYYTAALDATQTETFRYDLGAMATEPVTRTTDASEFSPTTIPGQDALSAIREERGRQFLWRYGADGADLGPIFATVEPVGYHAWADERTAAMFVLGNPPTLHVGDALSGEVGVVASNPGRSIHRVPGTGHISFVRKVSDDEWWIERLDPATGGTERIAQTIAGREDYAWTPDGEILMGDGTALFAWRADAGWTEVAGVDGDAGDGGAAGGEISRLAVSPDGSLVAIVRAR